MNFLVPYDFTTISRSALDHALQLSRTIGGEIELLHIISTEDSRDEMEAQFVELLSTLDPEDAVKVKTKVRLGDIYTDISNEAEEGHYQLLVMGTHGAKGLQKLLGSHAIKVISSSPTPFIVTQDKGPSPKIERIVLALDLSKERVQVVRFCAELAAQFKAEIHIVCQPEHDDWLVKKLSTNIQNSKNYLSRFGVKYEVHMLEGKEAFHKEVQKYGTSIRADLYAITHFTESIMPQFEVFSQAMITNTSQIPVLILNSMQIEDVKSNYSFISV